MTYLYLIHFDEPHPNGRHPRHYMGIADNLSHRINEHAAGSGSRLCRDMMKVQRIGFRVSRVWRYSSRSLATSLERRFKARKQHSDFCPICRGEKPDSRLNRYRRKPSER